jgi:hypothetical protein
MSAVIKVADEHDVFGWVPQPAEWGSVVGECRGSKAGCALSQWLACAR